VLDWSRLVLTQQGHTLSRYSLVSGRYLGYWALPAGATRLLDGYNRHALLANDDGSQLWLLFADLHVQPISTVSAPLPDGATLLDTVLCGTGRVCRLLSDGSAQVHYVPQSRKETRGMLTVSASTAVPQLAFPRRLLFDEHHSSLVLVATTGGSLHFSRAALPAVYAKKSGLAWGPVHSLPAAVEPNSTLPPMDVTTAEGQLTVGGNGTTVWHEHYGHAQWSETQSGTLQSQPRWRFLRAPYYHYTTNRTNEIIAIVLVTVTTLLLCLSACLVCSCLGTKFYRKGGCTPVVCRDFVPLYRNDTKYYRLANAARRLVSCCCCWVPERMQLRMDACLVPNRRTSKAQELSVASLLGPDHDITGGSMFNFRDSPRTAEPMHTSSADQAPPPRLAEQTLTFPSARLGTGDELPLLEDADEAPDSPAMAARGPSAFGQTTFTSVNLYSEE